MSSYAILDTNNIVLNVVEWDGTSEWIVPENTSVILITDVTGIPFIGLSYTGTIFNLPSPPPTLP